MQLVFSILYGAFIHSSSLRYSNRKLVASRLPSSRGLYESNDDGEYEPVYQEPNDFDLSLRLKSHQSSLYSGLTTQQYKPDDKRRSRIVWVIDDEQSIIDAVGSYLISSGYQVDTFLNATLPISLLKENRMPDAIVCDIMMPHVSGIDFICFIRTNESLKVQNIPFILLTAKGRTEDRIKGYDAGIDGYLMKPFDPEELVAMIDMAIKRKNVMQSDNESVTIEQLRKDLGEVKELLTMKERAIMLQKSEPKEKNNIALDTYSAEENIQLLSKDEIDVLLLLAEGYMNKEIASELQYSTRWVERHLTNMFRKTNCTSRTELVRWAVANGYVNLQGNF